MKISDSNKSRSKGTRELSVRKEDEEKGNVADKAHDQRVEIIFEVCSFEDKSHYSHDRKNKCEENEFSMELH